MKLYCPTCDEFVPVTHQHDGRYVGGFREPPTVVHGPDGGTTELFDGRPVGLARRRSGRIGVLKRPVELYRGTPIFNEDGTDNTPTERQRQRAQRVVEKPAQREVVEAPRRRPNDDRVVVWTSSVHRRRP